MHLYRNSEFLAESRYKLGFIDHDVALHACCHEQFFSEPCPAPALDQTSPWRDFVCPIKAPIWSSCVEAHQRDIQGQAGALDLDRRCDSAKIQRLRARSSAKRGQCEVTGRTG